MKPILMITVLICLALIMVAGCTPSAPETVEPTEESVIRKEPTETTVPPEDTVVPTLTSVPAPSMEVGSTFYYVDGTTLVAVPGGEFQMGGDGTDNTEHTVKLNAYWIYSTKVTNQQYAICEAGGKCTSPDPEDNPQYTDISHANDPVVGVTYDQAAAYCSFVNGRLPTEAEWEKSARHPDGGMYPWGDAEPSCDLLNFNNCAGGATNVIDYQAGKSYYGSLGMAGNAFEWASDWYAPDYYASSPADNPTGPTNGTSRSVRSSSHVSAADQVSVVNRSSEDPQNHRPDLSFRCVIEDPTFFAQSCEVPLVYGSDLNAATQPAGSCPALEIKQAPYCAGKLPLTNVKFVGPPDASIDSKNCVPSTKPELFTCQSPGTTVSISASCQLDVPAGSICPAGFTLENNTCVANGSSGQCFTGSYDSAQQCCLVQESTSTSVVCPVGMFYSISQNACFSYPVREVVSVVADVLFASCAPTPHPGAGGGGNGNQACQLPAGTSCPDEYSWDTARCCCELDWDSTQCVDP